MEIFYAYSVDGRSALLDEEESAHCVRVLRHRKGDDVEVIDGLGTLYHCVLEDDSPKKAVARVVSAEEGWHSHPYKLTMAVCPTKNNDRFEWFVEKATEVGVDVIAPVIGDRSERKVYKTDRARKIALSATKQSLKALVPVVEEPVSVKEFIRSDRGGLKLIAYCFEGEKGRTSAMEALRGLEDGGEVTVLIGPEGDFSPEEARLAIDCGYVPIHLGESRLRTETAAVTAAEAVYLRRL